ncbi:ABC transporter permease [Abiotrophia defectiva]|uniref:ABC transporter permease n=1 Tax=Abiotrophia defectiva TaxID=46125 RepID=UPI0028E798AD|nr:ABC transporter permease [Abiotrophia defectiva]
MKWYQRAWAYVSRKRVRVGLLFLILSLITTAVLAVFAIQISTQQVQDKLLSLSNAGFQLQAQGLQAGMKESDISQVAQVEGIADVQYQSEGLAKFESGQVIQAQQAVQRDQGDDIFNQLLSIQGRQDSQTDLDFASGALTLSQGRHLTPDDKDKVMVHEAFAEANKLQLGDKISLKGTQLTEGGEAKDGEAKEFEIVGIYSGKRSETFTGLSSDLTENRLYTDYASSQALYGRQADDYQVRLAQYRVTNPKELDQVISRVKALSLDWDQTQLTANSQAFDQVAAPIASFQSLMNLMTGAVLVVSVITLFLVLLFCLRERVHEFGILLSIGISKGQIIGQILLELWGLSIWAWAIAAAVAYPLANSFFSSLLVSNDLPDQVRKLFAAAAPSWQAGLVATSYGVVLLIIVVAVMACAGLILTKKPKEILGQLS